MSQPSENSGLNGLRIPLVIDAAMLVGVIIGGTTMWNKQEYLERQISSTVSAVSIAELKGEQKRLDDKLDRNVRDLLSIDERSQRDRQQLHERQEEIRQRMERLERGERR